MNDFRRYASQYSKKEQDQVIKAATDLELQLRGKLKPPYMVCAGIYSWYAEVEVWTDWEQTSPDCQDRYKRIPHKFEGQKVGVYCKDSAEFD